jgi:hypothetical protein
MIIPGENIFLDRRFFVTIIPTKTVGFDLERFEFSLRSEDRCGGVAPAVPGKRECEEWRECGI